MLISKCFFVQSLHTIVYRIKDIFNLSNNLSRLPALACGHDLSPTFFTGRVTFIVFKLHTVLPYITKELSYNGRPVCPLANVAFSSTKCLTNMKFSFI